MQELRNVVLDSQWMGGLWSGRSGDWSRHQEVASEDGRRDAYLVKSCRVSITATQSTKREYSWIFALLNDQRFKCFVLQELAGRCQVRDLQCQDLTGLLMERLNIRRRLFVDFTPTRPPPNSDHG